MRIQWFMGLGYIWLIGNIISNVWYSLILTEENRQLIQDMTYYRVMGFQDAVGIPVMGVKFFSNLPELLDFEYGYLTGGFAYLQILLMIVPLGIIYGLAQTFLPALISAAGSVFGRIFR